MSAHQQNRTDTERSSRAPVKRYCSVYIGFRNKGITPKVVTRILPWLNVEFGHCYLLWKSETCWLYLDPLMSGLLIKELPHDKGPQYIVDHSPNDRMLEFKCPEPIAQFHWRPWLGMLSCVTFTKYALGINGWKIITPHQLWKRLLKDGATEIKKQGEDNGVV